MHTTNQISGLLEKYYQQYNCLDFIELDPICIPHLFTIKQDIEIMGFLAAILAWGQRKTIIAKGKLLAILFDNSPYDFVLHSSTHEKNRLQSFCHRTFNGEDLIYFIHFLQQHYKQHNSLETAFFPSTNMPVQQALNQFQTYFFSLPTHPTRTKKHIARPSKNSSCKRLNMFLRWMVRKDSSGVDFGLWQAIKPASLICPIDVHVLRVANKLGLIETEKSTWENAILLTNKFKQFCSTDPVKYDFALFGLGVSGIM